jgi:hypothetical protein
MASPRIHYTTGSVKGSDLSQLKEITDPAANCKRCPLTDKDGSSDSDNTVCNSMGFYYPMVSLKTDPVLSRTQWDKQVVYQSERL